MSTAKPPQLLALDYAKFAREYLRSLPLEHFMEATTQATQRKITLESFDLIHASRPEIQLFSELLVQYPRAGQPKPGQVVPDNMVVVCEEPIGARGSFDVPREPARPFWVLEYISPDSARKDYDDSFHKYERELKVPYCLMFHPEEQELTLYRHNKRKYVIVKPNKHGRYPVAPLDLEVGLLDRWVRFWFQGELLPLPPDLLRQLQESRRETNEQRRRADEAMQRAEAESRRAEAESRRAEAESRRANEATQRAEAERQAKLAVERELETLRARLRQIQPPPGNGP